MATKITGQPDKLKRAKKDYEDNPNVAAKKGDILDLAEAVELLQARVAELESSSNSNFPESK